MKFIETLKNIWKIDDLRNKLGVTILFILIYRFGSFIVLPGINPEALTALQQQTSSGLMSLLDMFSGGAFSNASIFALGIMPYISASIVVQLLTIAIPYFQKMQREGESGRNKINRITRYLTVAILLFQGPSYLVNLKVQMLHAGSVMPEGLWFSISSTLILCAGSMFVMWLGERMTDRGIGNGISMIIMIGIIARLPEAFLVKMMNPFLLDDPQAGGLGLSTESVGLVYGTVGVAALTVGGILGGIAASRWGLKKSLWPMALSLTLPCLSFVFLAAYQPSNIWVIGYCVTLDQLGYGF